MRRPARRRGLVVTIAAMMALTAVVFFVVPDTQVPGRQVTRYDVTVDLEPDGAAQVTIDMDFDFGEQPGRGPFITLPTRQGFDEDHDRVFRLGPFTASSQTGAPTFRYFDRSDSVLRVRVGDKDFDGVRGTHQYTIGYRLEGMLNPRAGDGTYDELNWNAIGDAWEVPLSNVTVTVRGPADVARTTCYAGDVGSTEACAGASHSGRVATFTEPRLLPGQPLTVVAGWPAGTFEGAEVLLVPKQRPFALLDPMTPAGAIAALIVLLGVGGAVGLAWWRGRDRVFVGLTPGLTPADDGPARTGRRPRSTPVAVQLEPPRGIRPGLVGTLLDGVADPHDVTATIVDLAVRGYLRIEEVEEDKRWSTDEKEWRLVRLRPPDLDVEAFEATILAGIFVAGQTSVRLGSLRLAFADTMAKVQQELYDEVVERGWYRRSPGKVRAAWRVVGGAFAAVAVLAGLASLGTSMPDGYLLPCLALLLVGITIMVSGRHASGRTAQGSAVQAQILGFKHYIATAEARQLRWEEGEDIFSRYLPYAIVFEEAERWAELFEELAAQGRVPASTSWYAGESSPAGTVAVSTAAIGAALTTFTAAANVSFSGPTTGSSGGSGFSGGGSSGGGGSAGGGGGGGGGGGW